LLEGTSDIIVSIMERIIVQMERDSISELDQAAVESQMSRAAFVRAAVNAVLAERRRRRELKKVVDSYRASPQEDFTVSEETLRAVWPE
jgi:metal-responsive CopG/Arc/MetJ family transcriptional regulator